MEPKQPKTGKRKYVRKSVRDEKRKPVKIVKRYSHITMKHNYLKYHGIVMNWATKANSIKMVDLEILMFLYDEGAFNNARAKEFSVMYMGTKKMNKLIKDGWVAKWKPDQDGRAVLFDLTRKARLLIRSIYLKLNGEEPISDLFMINKQVERLTNTDKVRLMQVHRFNEVVSENSKDKKHPGRPKAKKGRLKKRPTIFSFIGNDPS